MTPLEKIIQLTRADSDVHQLLLEFPEAEILIRSLSEAQTTQLKAEYPTVFSELTSEAFCVNVISPEMVDKEGGAGYRKIRVYFSREGEIIKKILA